MAETKIPVERPLSPHLQTYRWTLTMALSIAHRVSGMSLYGGMILLVWWLLAAASGPNAYAKVQWFMGTVIGEIVLIGFAFALIHHALGGIRHLIWDTIHGLDPIGREWLARANLIGSIVLTLVVWVIGYFVMGGAR